MLYYLAQGIAVIAFMFFIFSFWLKQKKKLLFLQVISNIFYAVQFFMLGAINGGVSSVIAAIRTGVLRENHKKIILYLFLTIQLVFTLIFLEGYYGLLPMLATMTYTYFIYKGKVKSIIKGAIIASILWIPYEFITQAYMAFITEIILLISNLFAYKKHKK